MDGELLVMRQKVWKLQAAKLCGGGAPAKLFPH
jgi:hypothetical protein